MPDELTHLLERAAERLVDAPRPGRSFSGRTTPSAFGVVEVGLEELHLEQRHRQLLRRTVVDVEPDATEHALVALEDLGHRALERLVEPDLLEQGPDPLGADPCGVPAQRIVLDSGSAPATHTTPSDRSDERTGRASAWLNPATRRASGQAPAVEVDLHALPVGLAGDRRQRHGDVLESGEGC